MQHNCHMTNIKYGTDIGILSSHQQTMLPFFTSTVTQTSNISSQQHIPSIAAVACKAN